MDVVQMSVVKSMAFDTVVVGGGTTGTFAAIASARHGAQTALVEMGGFLGGIATAGLPWMAFHNYDEKRRIIGGIPYEAIERLRKVGGASDFVFDPILESTVYVNPHLLKIVLLQMIEEAGVHLFLHSLAGEVFLEEKTIRGIYIHNREGCQFLGANVVVDCTDCCNVAYRAGVPLKRGRDTDGKTQVASTVFTIGNVDVEQMIDYFRENPSQLRPHKLSDEELQFVVDRLDDAPLFSLGAFRNLIAKATSEGVRFPRETMIGIARPCQREIMLVTSRVADVDPLNEENFSQAEVTGYNQILEIMKFVNHYMPGGTHARVVHTGHTIGMRETSHIIGEYTLTSKDIVEGTKHHDAIAVGSYYMDIHTPDTKGLAPMIQPPIYSIPYRSLIPKGIDGLLVAGRCISATHEAISAVRVIPIAGTMGQAAGTAAALAASLGCTPRKVPLETLRKMLKQDGVYLEECM